MELESATGKLNAYFDGRQPEIMGMIERLVNMDSFSEDGEDVNKVGETVSGWTREAGFHTEKIAKTAIDPDESWMEKLGSVFSAVPTSGQPGRASFFWDTWARYIPHRNGGPPLPGGGAAPTAPAWPT